MKKPLKTIDIEIALMKFFNIRKKLIIPNVTDQSGLTLFETDMIILTTTGYATGVEIKVTKSDLKNDLKKTHIKNTAKFKWGKGHYFAPFKYFYYAIPETLLEATKNQIDQDFGILVVNGRGKVNIYRKPKLLNCKKWTLEEQYKLARLGALRILKYKEKMKRGFFR